MLLQIGALIGSALGQIGRQILPRALDIGTSFVDGLIQRELTRGQRNDAEDAIKAQLRAAANAVTPTVAPGQTAVYSGGPPTGVAFQPATFLPPSIEPPQRVLQINPEFAGGFSPEQFQQARRPPGAFVGSQLPLVAGPGPAPVQTAFFGTAARVLQRGAQSFGRFLRTPGGKGVAAGAIAAETAGAVIPQFVFPETAEAPGRIGGFPTTGDPLRIGGAMPSTIIPSGLPRTGVFQREANGVRVQWYFWDGSSNPTPIDRSQAECVKRECIFRLNVFTGKFVKLKSRRMNPMNVSAFFRAGRRVDASERICRKMFSEKRKQKTGTVRRRSRKKK